MSSLVARSAPIGAHAVKSPGGRPTPAPRSDPYRRLLLEHGVGVWAAWGIVGVATALNFGLALHELGTRSLWLDEGYSWLISSQPLGTSWRLSGTQGGHLFGYYFVLHVATSWFGDSPTVMRLPSVVAGTATVPFVYALSCRLGLNRLTGVVAATLFAVSLPLVYWEQNARDYSFVVLLATVTSLLITQAVQTGRTSRLVGWGVLTAVGCYTHPELLYLIPVHIVLFLLWSRSSAQRVAMLAVGAATVVGTVPVLLIAINSPTYSRALSSPPSLRGSREIAAFLASAAGTPSAITKADYALLIVTAAICSIGLVLLIVRLAGSGRSDANFGLALALPWLLVPFILSVAVSDTDRSPFLDRYLILSLPATAVVVALVLTSAPTRVLAVFGLVYLGIFRFAVILPTYGIPSEDWSSPTNLILADARPGDCVSFDLSPVRMLYDYYLNRDLSMLTPGVAPPLQMLPYVPPGNVRVTFYAVELPYTYVDTWQSPYGVQRTAPFCHRVWLIQSHAGTSTGSAISRSRYVSLTAFRRGLLTRYQLGPSYGFPGVRVTLYEEPSIPRP